MSVSFSDFMNRSQSDSNAKPSGIIWKTSTKQEQEQQTAASSSQEVQPHSSSSSSLLWKDDNTPTPKSLPSITPRSIFEAEEDDIISESHFPQSSQIKSQNTSSSSSSSTQQNNNFNHMENSATLAGSPLHAQDLTLSPAPRNSGALWPNFFQYFVQHFCLSVLNCLHYFTASVTRNRPITNSFHCFGR